MIENLDKLSKATIFTGIAVLATYVVGETVKEIKKNDPELGEQISSFFTAGIKAVAKKM